MEEGPTGTWTHSSPVEPESVAGDCPRGPGVAGDKEPRRPVLGRVIYGLSGDFNRVIAATSGVVSLRRVRRVGRSGSQCA